MRYGHQSIIYIEPHRLVGWVTHKVMVSDIDFKSVGSMTANDQQSNVILEEKLYSL